VDSVCEKNNFLWHHGVILKSLVGLVLSNTKGITRHSGTSSLRDARKIRASIDKIIIGLENEIGDEMDKKAEIEQGKRNNRWCKRLNF
jgi:hypothetical protein